jgi:GT2 family glycosyltransferase
MVARLAALIVNYNSGAYALGLARALRAQWREMGRDDRALELVVVDNASRAADAAPLELLRREGARVDVCDTNLGYAAGMNRALAHTQGSGGDLVLVLNPDLALFPGCLARLLATHALTPRLGALAPRAFLDPARQWRMPPNRLPTRAAQALDESASQDARLAAQLSRQRTRHALREWLAEKPLEVEMLSGACLLLSRSAIDAAGGLFDPRYPLYYEDSDLCRRLARAGLSLVLEPRAEIVHHWARSSGIESHDPEPSRRHALSRAAFFERWPDAPAEPASADESDGAPFPACAPLGALKAAPQLVFPHPGRWLVEVAMVATFPLAAGALVEAQSWRMDERAWEWFYRGRYFLRAHDLNLTNTSAAWWLDKPSAARTKPLEPNELTALGSMPV